MNEWFLCETRWGLVQPEWVSMHHWDIVLPHRRSCYVQGQVWSVSAKNERINFVPDQSRSSPTWPIIKASLRHRAPSSPIRFTLRSSVVNVYREGLCQLDQRREELLSYSIDLQCIGEITDSNRNNIVQTQIDCFERLWTGRMSIQ